MLTVVVASCGRPAAPPALVVGSISYAKSELGALNGRQRRELTLLTAFGEVISHDSLDYALEPFIQQDEQSRLLRRLAVEIEAQEAGLSDADLRRMYLQDPKYRLTVRHLVVLAKPYDPEEKKADARGRAAAALARIRAGEPFATVAAEVSEEPGAQQSGGLLPPGRQGTWVKEFWGAASSLKEGEVSGVIESPYGFHVLKLEKRETVPFDSVREEVLTRAVQRIDKADAARSWAREHVAAIRLDADAIRRYRSGDTANTALARWDGGTYTVDDFTSFSRTLPAEALSRLDATDPDAYEQVVRAAAGNRMLADLARSMGLRLDSATIRQVHADRRDQAHGWAVALGFGVGQPADAVKRAALSALGASSQGAVIAREEVLKLGPALERIYPVRTTMNGEDGT